MALFAPRRFTNFPAQGIWKLKNIRDEAAVEVGLWPRNAPPDTITCNPGTTYNISRADTTSVWKYYSLPAGKVVTIHLTAGAGTGGSCWNTGGGSGSNGGKASGTFTAVGDEVIMFAVGGKGGVGSNATSNQNAAGQGGGATACLNFFTNAEMVVAGGGSGGACGYNAAVGYGGNGGYIQSPFQAGPHTANGDPSSNQQASNQQWEALGGTDTAAGIHTTSSYSSGSGHEGGYGVTASGENPGDTGGANNSLYGEGGDCYGSSYGGGGGGGGGYYGGAGGVFKHSGAGGSSHVAAGLTSLANILSTPSGGSGGQDHNVPGLAGVDGAARLIIGS